MEVSRPSLLPGVLSGGSTVVGLDRALKYLLQELNYSEGVQARMDGLMFQRLADSSFSNPILSLIRDFLSSL